MFIAYRLNVSSKGLNTNFTIDDCLFGVLKLTKNANPDKYGYIGYGCGLYARSQFLLPNGDWDKYVVISDVDNSLSVHANNNNKKKDNVIFGEGPTDGLDDTIITKKGKYSDNTSDHRKKICLSLYYNVTNSFLYTNSIKIHQFKAKDSEIKELSIVFEKYSKRPYNQ